MTLQQPPSPGWYDGPNGTRQWWDGRSWHAPVDPGTALLPAVGHPVAQPHPQPGAQQPFVPPQVHLVHQVGTKEAGIAYALLIFLGGFGAHRFYLGRVGSAIGFLIVWQLGAWTAWTGFGLLFSAAAIVWWIVDLCTLGSMVREENARRLRDAFTAPGRFH